MSARGIRRKAKHFAIPKRVISSSEGEDDIVKEHLSGSGGLYSHIEAGDINTCLGLRGLGVGGPIDLPIEGSGGPRRIEIKVKTIPLSGRYGGASLQCASAYNSLQNTRACN